jgi:hypothetical protein
VSDPAGYIVITYTRDGQPWTAKGWENLHPDLASAQAELEELTRQDRLDGDEGGDRHQVCAVVPAAEPAPGTPLPAFADLSCPSCGSARFVGVSLDGGNTRRAQCVPCGTVHPKPVRWLEPEHAPIEASDA